MIGNERQTFTPVLVGCSQFLVGIVGHDLDILTTWKQEKSTNRSKSYSFILGVRISRVVGNAEVFFSILLIE